MKFFNILTLDGNRSENSTTSSSPVIVYPSEDPRVYVPPEGTEIDMKIVRSSLFGSDIFGEKGIYHQGLMFVTREQVPKAWVIDMIMTDWSKLFPVWDPEAARISMSNDMSLEYYSPETAPWNNYWTHTTDSLCRLTVGEYVECLKYIFTGYTRDYNKYCLFGISGVPRVEYTGERESTETVVYSWSNTCDKFTERVFGWIYESLGKEVRSHPLTRATIEVNTPPVEIKDVSDPGLVAYGKQMAQLEKLLGSINKRDVGGVYETVLRLQKSGGIKIFNYVFSYGSQGGEEKIYRLDVSGDNFLNPEIESVVVTYPSRVPKMSLCESFEDKECYKIWRWDVIQLKETGMRELPLIYFHPSAEFWQEAQKGDYQVELTISGTMSEYDGKKYVGTVDTSGTVPNSRPNFFAVTGLYVLVLHCEWNGYPPELGSFSLLGKEDVIERNQLMPIESEKSSLSQKDLDDTTEPTSNKAGDKKNTKSESDKSEASFTCFQLIIVVLFLVVIVLGLSLLGKSGKKTK